MKKERHNYTPQEKVSILRKHLIEKQPISEICEKHSLQPTVFHRWLKRFFENGAAAFEQESSQNSKKHQDKQQQRIDKLEEKLRKKDEVMAELLEEYVIVKKSLGEI